jgi:hypothetical protein
LKSTTKFRLPAAKALALYLATSVTLFGLPVITSLATVHVGYTNDPAMMMWYLAWWPYAIWHHVNPFITHVVWPATGYNLVWATSMPAVAIAMAPLTAKFGVVVAYNVAALIAPALSGWTAFLLCRHLTHKFWSAFAGGLIYGFSPYEVAHVLGGHLVLTFNFIAPICVLLVLLLVEGELTSRAFTIALAITFAVQFLISTEILATMTLFGGAALLMAAVASTAGRHCLRVAAAPTVSAYLLAAALLSPVLYYAFIKGSPPAAPIFPPSFFSADLLSFIVPGPLMLMHPLGADAVASRLTGNIWENGSYFSIPLLAIAALFLWRHRREGSARLLAVVVMIVAIAAMGPVLQVARRRLLPLPWAGAAAFPLIRHALPIRFVNYGFLTLAIIFSLWLSEPRFPFKNVLAAVAIIALFPNPAFLLRKSSYDEPAFFAKGMYRDYLRTGENVLIIPFGRDGPSMAWQAQSWMYFRMPGGHLSTMPSDFRRWPIVNTLLTSLPVAEPAEQLKAFVAAYHVDAIVVVDSAKGIVRELPALLGIKPVEAGGVLLYRLSRHAMIPSISDLTDLQRAATEGWLMLMLCAAQRFVAAGRDPAGLEPARAYALGLLPPSKWSDNLDLLVAGLPHGATNGLWVGPGTDGTIEIGLPASRASTNALVSSYGADAEQVLYPYPWRYSTTPASGDTVDFLLMSLRQAALKRCGAGFAESPATAPK